MLHKWPNLFLLLIALQSFSFFAYAEVKELKIIQNHKQVMAAAEEHVQAGPYLLTNEKGMAVGGYGDSEHLVVRNRLSGEIVRTHRSFFSILPPARITRRLSSTRGDWQISPDGRHAIFRSHPRHIYIIDLESGKRRSRLKGTDLKTYEEAGAYASRWTPSNRHILLGLSTDNSNETILSSFNIETGGRSELLRKTHTAYVIISNIILSPNGKFAAINFSHGDTELIEIEEDSLGRLQGKSTRKVSQDVLSISNDGLLITESRVEKFATGEITLNLETNHNLRQATFSSSGDRVIGVVSDSGILNVEEYERGNEVPEHGTKSLALVIWDAATGKKVAAANVQLKGMPFGYASAGSSLQIFEKDEIARVNVFPSLSPAAYSIDISTKY